MTFRFPFFNSLPSKLALVFTVGVALVAFSQLVIVLPMYRELSRELSQRSQWNLASEIANAVQPHLLSDIDEQAEHAIRSQLSSISLFNNDLELYVLNAAGEVLFEGLSVAIPRSSKAFALGPIREALDGGYYEVPLYGVDASLDERTKAIFSVSPVQIGSGESAEQGYVYVVLESFSLSKLSESYGQLFILKSIFGGVIALVVLAALISIVMYRYLTRNFKRLMNLVEQYEEGEFSARLHIENNDEISRLADAMNGMAETIEENSIARRRMLAGISHDLRTPLTASKGFVELLLERNFDDTSKEYLEVTYSNILEQEEMVESLFELAKLDAMSELPTRAPFGARELLESLALSFEAIAREKGITIQVSEVDETVFVHGDRHLIYRVMGNLISNALRYSGEGTEVVLGGDLRDEDLRFYVRDSGPGIAEEHLKKLFDPFYRVDEDRSREAGGTGLGLAIVQRILKLHGTVPVAESVVGEGTTFYFDLPVDDRQ